MIEVSHEMLDKANVNWYELVPPPHGFFAHIRDKFGVKLSYTDPNIKVSEELYNYLSDLASPHYCTLMKARKCREQ